MGPLSSVDAISDNGLGLDDPLSPNSDLSNNLFEGGCLSPIGDLSDNPGFGGHLSPICDLSINFSGAGNRLSLIKNFSENPIGVAGNTLATKSGVSSSNVKSISYAPPLALNARTSGQMSRLEHLARLDLEARFIGEAMSRVMNIDMHQCSNDQSGEGDLDIKDLNNAYTKV